MHLVTLHITHVCRSLTRTRGHTAEQTVMFAPVYSERHGSLPVDRFTVPSHFVAILQTSVYERAGTLHGNRIRKVQTCAEKVFLRSY